MSLRIRDELVTFKACSITGTLTEGDWCIRHAPSPPTGKRSPCLVTYWSERQLARASWGDLWRWRRRVWKGARPQRRPAWLLPIACSAVWFLVGWLICLAVAR